MLELEAHAKVNLTLEVLGRRDDGYHDIVSIMQTVGLHDTVTLSPADDITLVCDDVALAGDENLAVIAARRLRDHVDAGHGAEIRLEKRIPVASGLGGGSSDAAAVLTGLNQLWDLDLDLPELEKIAVEIGSDVPFFLSGGTALVQGKGEHVVPLAHANIQWMVVVSPDSPEFVVPDKTARLYDAVARSDYTRGVLTHKLAGRIRGGGDAPAQFYFNVFEPYASTVFAEYAAVRNTFRSLGAMGILMSGAGPSMFALAPSREVGLAWQLMLERQHGLRAYLTRRWDPPGARRRPTNRAHVNRGPAG